MRSACADHLRAQGFREPKDHHLRELEPCGWCFPDGEVDVPREDLVVATGGDSERLHRDDSTGKADYSRPSVTGEKLSTRLADPEFTFDDLGAAGGDGGEA